MTWETRKLHYLYCKSFVDDLQVLVACYTTLLSFYSRVMAFLLEESQIRRILQTFQPEIPRIVTTFNGQADQLSKMMEVETLVTVTKIWNRNVDNFGMWT